jgi:hypothetical protein
MRKNPKIIKILLNEIKYLQLLIFAKRDFSHVLRLCGEKNSHISPPRLGGRGGAKAK